MPAKGARRRSGRYNGGNKVRGWGKPRPYKLGIRQVHCVTVWPLDGGGLR